MGVSKFTAVAFQFTLKNRKKKKAIQSDGFLPLNC